MELPEFYLLFKLALNFEYRNTKIYVLKNENNSQFLRKFKEKKGKSPFFQFLSIILDMTNKSLPWVTEIRDLLDFSANCFELAQDEMNFSQMHWGDQRMIEILHYVNEAETMLREIFEIFSKWKNCFQDYVKL